MPALGKTNASRVNIGDRILVFVDGDYREVSRTKTGPGVTVARVTGKTMTGGRYYLETSAGPVRNLAPIQTMWLAPEDLAGVKRAHVEALAINHMKDTAAAILREELAHQEAEARVATAQAGVAEALDNLAPALKEEAAEEPPTAEEALAAIGGCWAGGARTGEALKAYALGDYAAAYRVAQDQKALQLRQEAEGGQEAIHPEHREAPEPDVTRSLEAVGQATAADLLELVEPTDPWEELKADADCSHGPVMELKVPLKPPVDVRTDAQVYAFAGSVAGVGEVWVAPMGTPEPTAEDLSDLAAALAEEEREHLEPEAVRPPLDHALRCHPRDVVTIHQGTRLYRVERVEGDYSTNNITSEVVDHSMALVSPLDPEDHRDAQWVHLDLLHVRKPVARVQTLEITQRVRQAPEVFRVDERLVAVRTIQMDAARVPMATLAGVLDLGHAAPVATLRAGEAIVVDGRCFAVTEDGNLEAAPHRDRLSIPHQG